MMFMIAWIKLAKQLNKMNKQKKKQNKGAVNDRPCICLIFAFLIRYRGAHYASA